MATPITTPAPTPTPGSQSPMTLDQFGQIIKQKYPGAYDSIDNTTLANQVLAKYPQYQSQIQTKAPPQTLGQKIGGIAKKVGGFLTNQLPAIGSTIGAIGGGALGAVATAPTVAGVPEGTYAGAVGGSALGGEIGQGVKNLIQGGAVSPSSLAKAGLGYGALEAVAGPLFSLAGKAVEAGGKTLGEMFIPKSDAEAGALQTYKAGTSLLDRVKALSGSSTAKTPTTAASTAFDKGLVGTESMIGVQAKRAQTSLWDNVIGPALKQSDTKINMQDFLNQAEAKITKETPELTRQSSLLNALDSIKEDYAKTKTISLEQLQKLKEGWADFVPEKAYKGQPIAGALNDVRNTLAGMARSTIYDSLGENVKQAYVDYGNLNGIKALGRKAMTGAIKGGTGTSIKNLLEQATIPIGTLGGQTIYKIGQGIELLGAPGARIVRDVLASPILSSGSSANSTQTQTPNTPTPPASTPPTLQPTQ